MNSISINYPKIPHWNAVFSLFMGVTSLISAEFIPISLLTNIANELHITEGQAGQSVTAVGVLAVITSLLIAPLTTKINPRHILLTFSATLIISNLLVALSPNFTILLIGRSLLGICVGGFWSLISAVTLQLVPQQNVPRALSVIYAGVSVATIIALPFASYLGDLLGWRTIFYLSALLGVLTLVWQYITLPTLSTNNKSNFKEMVNLLNQSWVITGLIAIICSYAGYHIFFTYMKPFLQYNLNLSHGGLTITLFCFGIINCFGTLIASFFINRSFQTTMISIHIILGIVAVAFLFNQHSFFENIITVLLWAFIFGIIPVGWSTWIARTLPKQAEMAGGFMVASIQLSITLAAALGGMIFDHYGVPALFLAAACIFIMAITFTYLSFSLLYKITKEKI
ncbi:MFS transporter [Commensalibacter papalotli (ex Botero et al. 2024)]|uniref:MFS family (AraJ) (PDB:4LDS) n=1 Tax=Commensalibacter papalotli (ex Botero et al. 2024) TaxID=2972766 RepID=A0ABN8WFE7_9PROT|nr:MFS transporter [Commensalibacter papalotli (ex Botero et al. 2024)]CAI3931000.1 MFS family (AraJ) (PDB:4LDS) [Commensalibacter papalotli (ex Botero et al. 2024)]CAI3944671.1 MFS family (AraJ) (PDB:4LDS) [Commensalibacter papalotli (ex Botero et al. 2024)]